MPHSYLKTGYLHEDFRFFHIRDCAVRTFGAHYHDFYKLLLFIRGDITYTIEGSSYQPLPGDVLLVPAGDVHQPAILSPSEYERIIFYISESFFQHQQKQGYDLKSLFVSASETQSYLLRPEKVTGDRLSHICSELLDSMGRQGSLNELYQRLKLMEILILLTDAHHASEDLLLKSRRIHPVVRSTLSYIHTHLREEDLCIDRIAAEMFLNRSYLMHLFRKETGYSIGQYITEKRLFLAESMIEGGACVTAAWSDCGFPSYAAFYHARAKKKSTGSPL